MSLQPGDRAMLVFGCCAETRSHIGLILTVERLERFDALCEACGYGAMMNLAICSPAMTTGAWPAAWLKKLDDPAEQNERVVSEQEAAHAGD